MQASGIGVRSRDSAFWAMDWRFRLALAGLDPVYHSLSYGQAYESIVCDEIAKLIPPPCVVDGALLEVENTDEGGKQVDFVVRFPHSAIFGQGAATLTPARGMLVAGEIKTNMTDRGDILKTASRVAAAAEQEGLSRLAFTLIAGDVNYSREDGSSGGPTTMVNLIKEIATEHPVLWPSGFVLGRAADTPGSSTNLAATHAYSVLAVDDQTPLQMSNADGVVQGVVTVDSASMSPSGLLYLWLWAALNERGALPAWDYSLMHQAVEDLTTREPVDATVLSLGGKRDCSLTFTLGEPANAVAPRSSGPAHPAHSEDMPLPTFPAPEAPERAVEGRRRKVMLINLGGWVSDPSTWDESPWGGKLEQRFGYGYYDGMSQRELLDSARVFWSFNPESSTWQGIEYAVVSYRGVVRAVLRIDKFIGPLWGRYGFQGSVVDDPELVAELVGRQVPTRRNPVTTIDL